MRTVNDSSAAWTDMPPANSSSVASAESLRVLCDIVVLFHSYSITLDVRTAPLQPLRRVPAAVNGVCARPTNGHTAATPPSSVTNLRRVIHHLVVGEMPAGWTSNRFNP